MIEIGTYLRAKKAKSAVKRKELLGWPVTVDGILRVFQEMPEDEKTVILSGRFLRRYDNRYTFLIPPTTRVIDAMEGRVDLPDEVVFVEDMEG